MAAMGLLPVPEAYAGPPELPPGSGRGVTVAIIGAGIAGMVAAFELRKADYRCVILEARDRPGGRNWTLRGGDLIEEQGSRQRVKWDHGEHMYFNPGPARLPYHHDGILSYCRTLGVPLEVMINDNRGAFLHDEHSFDGKPQRARRVINDSRGFIAELAAKCPDQPALSAALSDDDKAKLREALKDPLKSPLKSFGDLEDDFVYRGSKRAGYERPPGVDQDGKKNAPLDWQKLVQSSFWENMSFGEGEDQAATMLQPVGGIDQIGRAFGKALGRTIVYGAEVITLRKKSPGVHIKWKRRKDGTMHPLEADYVICTVPFTALRGLDANFSPEVKSGIMALKYVPAVKVAFQADRRFWELDDQIYGGISWTSRDVTQIWYPSAGIHQKKGIIVGAYIWSDMIGDPVSKMTPPDRLSMAKKSGGLIHPGYADKVSRGVTVAWRNIPFTGGAWAEWSEKEDRRSVYPTFLKPDGEIYFAGEHLSYLTGWQEGALRSSHHVVRQIAERVQALRK